MKPFTQFEVRHYPQFRHAYVVFDMWAGQRKEGFNSRKEAQARCNVLNSDCGPDAEDDPTRWCNGCGAMRKSDCACGALAEND